MRKFDERQAERERKQWKNAQQTLRNQVGYIGLVAVDRMLRPKQNTELTDAIVKGLYGNSDVFMSSLAHLFSQRKERLIANLTMASVTDQLKTRFEDEKIGRLALSRKHSLLDYPQIDHLSGIIEQNGREHKHKGNLPECTQVFIVPSEQVWAFGLKLYPGDEGYLHMLERVPHGDVISTEWDNKQLVLPTVEQALRIKAGIETDWRPH